ncbi:MAG TPA: DMT family transporter [candidate division Zixibacteria bacterium]|nr:DMT family transporter [candidate division Zixibacteria bacterium]
MVNNLLIVALCLIWGATWVAIKIGLSDSPPFYGAAFRFLIATFTLAIIVSLGRRKLPKNGRTLVWIVISGLLMYVGSYAVVYYVEQYINAALASILFASFPFFVAIGAHFHLDNERLTFMRLIGLVVGFAGVVVVFSGGVTAPETTHWWAPIVMILSPLTAAVASIIVKRHLTSDDPSSVNFLQMAVGSAALFALAAGTENLTDFHWTAAATGAVVFLALFGSVFTFVTYYHLLRTMEATKLALIAFVTPLVASLLDYLVLGATLSTATMIGAALVLVGIYLVNIAGARRVRTPAV